MSPTPTETPKDDTKLAIDFGEMRLNSRFTQLYSDYNQSKVLEDLFLSDTTTRRIRRRSISPSYKTANKKISHRNMPYHQQQQQQHSSFSSSSSTDPSTGSATTSADSNDLTTSRRPVKERRSLIRAARLTFAATTSKPLAAFAIGASCCSNITLINTAIPRVPPTATADDLDDDIVEDIDIIQRLRPLPSSTTIAASQSISSNQTVPSSSLSELRNSLPSCSNEASQHDDVNVDELASYLEHFMHIPKKMSDMAEMMYT